MYLEFLFLELIEFVILSMIELINFLSKLFNGYQNVIVCLLNVFLLFYYFIHYIYDTLLKQIVQTRSIQIVL